MEYLVAHCRRIKTAVGLRNVASHNSRTAVYDEKFRPLGKTPDYIDPASGKYNEGDRPPPEAVLKRRNDRIREANLIRKPQKNASQAVEVVITATQSWFVRHISLDEEKTVKAFFADARKALNERFGADNLLQWNVHYDEKTPHMHLLYVPIVQTEKGNKYSADAMLGNRKTMEEFQDYMIAKLGKKYGLDRGVRGSKARHTDQYSYAKQIREKEEELKASERSIELREAKLREAEKMVRAQVDALNDRDRERVMRKVQDNYRER